MTAKRLQFSEHVAIEIKLNETIQKLKLIEQEEYIEYWKNLSIIDIEKEEWKDIVRYEGFYQISNYCRIKTVVPRNKMETPPPKIMKQQCNNKGYRFITLAVPNKAYKKGLVHRLVAEAWIPNPNNFPCVNHINGNSQDCRIINLEWCTRSHNNYHKTRILNKVGYDHYKGENNPQSKKVIQKDIQGNIIKVWGSQGEICRNLGFQQGDISRCCTGKNSSGISHGFRWEFV